MTAGGMDADFDGCMEAGGRAMQDAKAERTRTYLQRVMREGYPFARRLVMAKLAEPTRHRQRLRYRGITRCHRPC